MRFGLLAVGRGIRRPASIHRRGNAGGLVGNEVLAPLHKLFPLSPATIDNLTAMIHKIANLLLALIDKGAYMFLAFIYQRAHVFRSFARTGFHILRALAGSVCDILASLLATLGS